MFVIPKNEYNNRIIIPYYKLGDKWNQFDARSLDENAILRYKNLKNVEKKIKLKANEKKKYVTQKKKVENEIKELDLKKTKLRGSIRLVDKKILKNMKKESVFTEEIRMSEIKLKDLGRYLNE